MKTDIALIGNPVAGGSALKRIKRAAAILESRGFAVNLMLTGGRGDAEKFARVESRKKEAAGQGAEGARELLVIAAGGDGTYNEVANGLVHSSVPMAILPMGTTCVLARELNVPEKLEAAIDVAIGGRVLTAHLGKITLMKEDGSRGSSSHASRVTRYFLLMAGIGFDGDIVYDVRGGIKKIAGRGAYILGGLRTLFTYRPEPVSIKDASGSSEHTCFSAIVGKASCYGGDFKITPDAKLTDPAFYAFLTYGNGRLDLVKYIIGVLRGRHLEYRDISYFRTADLEVRGSAHIQIDGDYLGTAPARIEIERDALKLISGNQ